MTAMNANCFYAEKDAIGGEAPHGCQRTATILMRHLDDKEDSFPVCESCCESLLLSGDFGYAIAKTFRATDSTLDQEQEDRLSGGGGEVEG